MARLVRQLLSRELGSTIRSCSSASTGFSHEFLCAAVSGKPVNLSVLEAPGVMCSISKDDLVSLHQG
jgi:hypothetical protein